MNHCAINIALYGKPGARWAMTERSRTRVQRREQQLIIGPSALRWGDGRLQIELDEVCAPIPRRVRGSISIAPQGFTKQRFALDAAGRHVWQPIAPRAEITVSLDCPSLNWDGTAYLDSNLGTEPLGKTFRNWTWSRTHLAKDTAIFYDATERDGRETTLALRIDPDGRINIVEPSSKTRLPTTAWGISREARSDIGAVRVRKTLEDTPFYARSLLESVVYGERAETFHESLSLERFGSNIVRMMLPFRMPRDVF